MTALLASELQRISSRRLTRALMLLLVGFFSIAPFQDIVRRPASKPFMLVVDAPDIPHVLGLMVGFLAVVLGASAFGADTGSGTLATQLTWEPRRTRVLIARGLSVAMAAVAIYVVTVIASLSAIAIATSIAPHASNAGADAAFWSDRIADAAVATGGVACCAVAGLALGALLWSSTGPIVLVGALSIVGEPLLANWSALPQGLRHRLPLSSLFGLSSAGELTGQRLPGVGAAAVAWSLGLFLVAAISFGRREIR